MNLNPKELSNADYDHWQHLTKDVPTSPEQWRQIASFVLEVVGVLNAVQLGDVQLWRHAISKRSEGPLPPLNLPLSLWEAYLSSPFSGLTLKLADGRAIEVGTWEDVFFSWHSRMIGIALSDSFYACPANDVTALPHSTPIPSHTTVLERLDLFKSAEPFSPICVRTKTGKAYLIEEPSYFRVDHSGSILAIARPSGTELIAIREIESVRSANDQKAILEQIVTAKKATPFRPFELNFCNGVRWKVHCADQLIISEKRLILGDGKETSRGFENTKQIDTEWLDTLVFMSNPQGQ